MKKVSVIGLFCTGRDIADGQSIKTRIVAREIEKNIGSQEMQRIDTYGWKKNPFRLFWNCIKAVCGSKNVVFLTDAGGINVFPWLLNCVNIFFNRTIHYVVVGGWIVNYVKKHKVIPWFLKKLDGIFVETTVMKSILEGEGFKNVHLMPNFKDLVPIEENNLSISNSEPCRLCIFSRIMREKGIENAVDAVKRINNKMGRIVCTLDLYGQIDSLQTEWFENFQKTAFTDEIQYHGIAPFDKSVEILKDYYALLFPTQFYTEGIPGTIIDAYAAGIPVIASEWESVFDIVEPSVTGLTYPFDKPEALQEKIEFIIDNPELVLDMKKRCLKKAEEYLPTTVIDILLSRLS